MVWRMDPKEKEKGTHRLVCLGETGRGGEWGPSSHPKSDGRDAHLCTFDRVRTATQSTYPQLMRGCGQYVPGHG